MKCGQEKKIQMAISQSNTTIIWVNDANKSFSFHKDKKILKIGKNTFKKLFWLTFLLCFVVQLRNEGVRKGRSKKSENNRDGTENSIRC